MDNILFWFSNNGIVANPDKFQVIFLLVRECIDLKIGPFTVNSAEEVKLLGVTLDN